MAQAILAWDRTALLWISGHHAPWLDVILLPISLLGEAGALWFAVALALLIFGGRELKITGLMLLLTIIIVDRLVSVRIPMKAATRSEGKRPAIPIESGHFAGFGAKRRRGVVHLVSVVPVFSFVDKGLLRFRMDSPFKVMG